MNSFKENIFGTRLKLARKMAGLSLQELATALENEVSKQALSKYENGLMNPSGEVLTSIAKVFKLKPEYFLKKESFQLGEISFRKKVRLSKKDEESIVEMARDYVERFIEIENILGIKVQFENPVLDIKVKNKSDAERAAKKLRIDWNLGDVPIPNLVMMLELKGVKVFLLDTVDEFDGLAVLTSSGIPIVAINTKDRPLERIRFTIIHELAHLLLDFENTVLNEVKTIENLCHYFSSCFLIPSDVVVKLIGPKRTYINISELISVKQYYGISLRAFVHRLKELQVITENYYRRWMIYMSKTYGAKKEPGNYNGEEKATTFDQLVNRALAEGLISISKAASLWNVSINDIRKGKKGA